MDLPLPIARLVRRARNEKSPKGRHDTAYFAWEASLRVAVAARPPTDPQPLRVPSTGDWARAMVAGMVRDEEALEIDEFLAAYELMTEVGTGKASRPRSISVRRLIDVLPAYRNQVIGHGSTRSAGFYDGGFEVLTSALTRAWSEGVFWPTTATLLYVESVSVAADGSRVARVFDLTGVASTVIDARGNTPVPEQILPHRLYLRDGEQYRSLYPWLLFQEDEFGERVWFFNGRKRRAQFLDYVSGASLRGRQLTQAFPELAGHLDAVLTTSAPALSEDAEPVDTELYGDYRIRGKLGAGGMGVVYEAVHESLDRRVALKTLPPVAAEDPVALARFKREIAALAQCEHPNVVKILDSGAAHDTHYYVMELVEGQQLGAVQMAEGRGESQRIRDIAILFRDAAGAVQHLHDQGILHRDIKPQNLMVTDADHRVVVMDLGLAAVGDASQSITVDKGSILGTLRYMPAEQLQRNLLRLDRRADVYSLGATFYEVFTGQPFFDGDSEVRLIQQVLHEQPLEPEKANPQLPADIATILRKATEKDPRLRYDTAEALRQDISAFLTGAPISARPPTLGYLLGLAIRRHKALALAIGLVLLAAVVSAALYIQRERTVAREQRALRQNAERARDLAEANFAALLSEQGRNAMLSRERRRALAYLSEAYSRGRDTVAVRHLLSAATRDLDSLRYTLGPDESGFESIAFTDGGRIATVNGSGAIQLWAGAEKAAEHATGVRVLDAELSPDGRFAAISDVEDKLSVWRVEDGQRLWSATYEIFGGARLRFAASGDKLAAIDGTAATAQVWEVATGKTLATLSGHSERLYDVVFSPDSSQVITCSEDGTARIWDTAEFAVQTVLSADLNDISTAAFAPDGNYVVTGSWDRIARVWDLPSGQLVHVLTSHYGRITAVAWSGDGEMIATADQYGALRVWDTRGQILSQARDHAGELALLAFSPDSSQLVGAGADQRVHVWDAASLARLTAEPAHQGGVKALAFDRQGPRLATVGAWDDTAKVWTTRLGSLQVRLPSLTTAWTESAQRVILATTREFRSWDFTTGAELARMGDLEYMPLRIVADAQGRRVATAGLSRVQVFDLHRRERLAVIEHGDQVAISGSGERLATVEIGKTVKVWDASSGRLLHTFQVAEENPLAAALSPSGDRLAVVFASAAVRVWDATSGELAYLAQADHDGDDVQFAPSGRSFVVFGNKSPNIVDAASGAVRARLGGHAEKVAHVAFSADEARVATAADDKTVGVFVAETGAKLASATESVGVAISADGLRFATGAEDGTVRIWDVMSNKLLTRLQGHRQAIVGLAFSADGRRLATHSDDSTVVIWDVHLETRSTADIAKLAREHSPWRLVDGQLVARPAEPVAKQTATVPAESPTERPGF